MYIYIYIASFDPSFTFIAIPLAKTARATTYSRDPAPHTWKFLLLAVAILFGGSVAVTILTVSIHSSHSRGEAFVHRCGTHSAAGMSLTCASKMSYHILPVSKTRHRPWWLANVPMFGELGHGNPHFSWVNLLTCCCTPETTLGKVRKDLVKLYNIKYDTTSLTWNLRLLWDTYPMLSRKNKNTSFHPLCGYRSNSWAGQYFPEFV